MNINYITACAIKKWLNGPVNVGCLLCNIAIAVDDVLEILECMHQQHWILIELRAVTHGMLEKLASRALYNVEPVAQLIIEILCQNLASVNEHPGNWAIDDTRVYPWHYAPAA